MALDPQVQAVLDRIARAGRPSYHLLSPAEARRLYRDTRADLQPKPPDLGVVRDLAADGPAGPIPLRLYRPLRAARDARLPVLVYLHGGGWVIGDLDTHDVLCRQLADRGGFSVIAVDYRLAPEHKFPAAVEDAWSALRWIVAHAAELGVDGRRVAVGGDSAGGNLSAVLALRARDAGGPALAFQLLIYPATDLANDSPSHRAFGQGLLLTRDNIEWFTGHYLRTGADVADWQASPARARSLDGLPPALVITAGFDPLRDEGEAYARRLRDAGVTVDDVCYGGMVHGFLPMGGVVDTADRAVTEAAAAVAQALR